MPISAMTASGPHNALEAHPGQPGCRCHERQQRRQHEGSEQEQPDSREAWWGAVCHVPRFARYAANGVGTGMVILCASRVHLAVARLLVSVLSSQQFRRTVAD